MIIRTHGKSWKLISVTLPQKQGIINHLYTKNHLLAIRGSAGLLIIFELIIKTLIKNCYIRRYQSFHKEKR